MVVPNASSSAPPIARNYEGFRALLNNRRIELRISMLELDALAQLPSGYAAKILCGTRRKGGAYHNIGPQSMGKLLAALGVVIRLEQAQDCDDLPPSGIANCPQLKLLRERARIGG